MNAGPRSGAFEPFFLPAAHGERFCIFHPATATERGSLVYVHPFAEEMNKSRRMAALQSRMLAASGIAVLQIDLLGCGDSSGELRDATWELWRHDVQLAVQWLAGRGRGHVGLWGLRLGALLALDAARDCDPAPAQFVLWQPVTSGEQFLTQFLRLRVATGMIASGVASTSTQDLRNHLKAGTLLEIAGYDLTPALAASIDALKLAELAPRSARVNWLEVVAEAGRPLPPASRRIADAWSAGGVDVGTCTVAGDPFWNTVEVAECPALLEETTRVLGQARR